MLVVAGLKSHAEIITVIKDGSTSPAVALGVSGGWRRLILQRWKEAELKMWFMCSDGGWGVGGGGLMLLRMTPRRMNPY